MTLIGVAALLWLVVALVLVVAAVGVALTVILWTVRLLLRERRPDGPSGR